MPGIRVNYPTGADWSYSLDLINWQSSPVFAEVGPGNPFVVGTVYNVFCRNVVQEIDAVSAIEFGAKDNQDTLHTVAGRGRAGRQGWTNLLLQLMGGLMLDKIPITTEDYDTLVLGPDKRVYRKQGTVIAPVPAFLVVSHVRAVPNSLPVKARGSVDINNCELVSGWAGDENHPESDVVVVIEVDDAIEARIVPFKERVDVRDVLISEGINTTRIKWGFEWQKPAKFNDGRPHKLRAYVEGYRDVAFRYNVTQTITCGAPPVKTVTDLILLGPVWIREGAAPAQYTVQAIYNDGTSAYVTSLSNIAINGIGVGITAVGLASAYTNQTTGDNRKATITASFGGINKSLEIDVYDATVVAPTRVSITIKGAPSLDEGKQTPYYVEATLSNGQTENVPQSQVSFELLDETATDILDTNGLLTALNNAVVGDTRSVRVKATVGTLTNTLPVSIIDKTVPAPAINRAPVMVQQFAPATVTGAGVQTLTIPLESFEDPDGDALTWNELTTNAGAALPNGLTYNKATRVITIPEGYPNTQISLRITVTDPGGLSAEMYFLLTVNRVAVKVQSAVVWRSPNGVLQFGFRLSTPGFVNEYETLWEVGYTDYADIGQIATPGYADYQYGIGYSPYSSFAAFLSGPTTMKVRKKGQPNDLLSFSFSALNLAIDEVRVIYTAP